MGMNKTFLLLSLVSVLFFVSCAPNEKNVSMSSIEERIVSEFKFEKPVITDIKGNNAAAERYGIPLSKIEEGFVYANEDDVKKADEIIVIKIKDKKNVSEIERALETEITGLSVAWEGISKEEYEKVKKHILRSKGKYVLLAICADSKKVEEVFNDLLR